jgi:very-short-patch-repair endonuclease
VHHPSRRILAHRATGLAAPTTTEVLLWGALRGSQLGVGFRRQFLIGKYRVDFAAPQVRLVVEVDGGYHRLRQRADARRDRDLERLGWRVLRLPAELVLHRLSDAVALVRTAVDGDR